MGWFDETYAAGGDLAAQWGAAVGIGDGTAYQTGKTSETVPMNAVQSMQPITSGVVSPSWGNFLQNTLGGLVGYAIQKDAARNGVVAPQGPAPEPAQQAQAQGSSARPVNTLVMPLLIGLGVVVAGVVAYKLVK